MTKSYTFFLFCCCHILYLLKASCPSTNYLSRWPASSMGKRGNRGLAFLPQLVLYLCVCCLKKKRRKKRVSTENLHAFRIMTPWLKYAFNILCFDSIFIDLHLFLFTTQFSWMSSLICMCVCVCAHKKKRDTHPCTLIPNKYSTQNQFLYTYTFLHDERKMFMYMWRWRWHDKSVTKPRQLTNDIYQHNEVLSAGLCHPTQCSLPPVLFQIKFLEIWNNQQYLH